MKNLILGAILILLGSCSPNKSLVGLYGECDKRGYFVCSRIELKSDSTFEYYIFFDVGGGHVLKGPWHKISNDTIVLNTYEQPQILKTTYKGKINPDLKGKVRVYIMHQDEELSFSIVSINDGEQTIISDLNGLAEFSSESVKNITYSYLGQEETIPIDNPNYNEVEISIKDYGMEGPTPIYLTNYKVVIGKKKLFMDTNQEYKKTPLKNKKWK